MFLQQSPQMITLLQLKDALFPDPVEFTGFFCPVPKKLISKSLQCSIRTLIGAGVIQHQPCALTRAAKTLVPSRACRESMHRDPRDITQCSGDALLGRCSQAISETKPENQQEKFGRKKVTAENWG